MDLVGMLTYLLNLQTFGEPWHTWRSKTVWWNAMITECFDETISWTNVRLWSIDHLRCMSKLWAVSLLLSLLSLCFIVIIIIIIIIINIIVTIIIMIIIIIIISIMYHANLMVSKVNKVVFCCWFSMFLRPGQASPVCHRWLIKRAKLRGVPWSQGGAPSYDCCCCCCCCCFVNSK